MYQEVFDIVIEGYSDSITAHKKTKKLLHLFAVEMLPLVVEAINKILIEEDISEQNKQNLPETNRIHAQSIKKLLLNEEE
jgi:hypothetical protein